MIMSAMLDYLYIKSMVDAMFDTIENEKLTLLRCSALKNLYRTALYYLSENLLTCLVEGFFEKKANFILQAETTKQMNEILEPSVPYYDYNSLKPKSIYHVDEEELLLWSLVSPHVNFMDCAEERYKELFIKILPEQATLIDLQKTEKRDEL